MASKMLAFDHEAREAMRRGVRRLAHVVKVTLGPRGRVVPLPLKYDAPDGVTVAKEIELKDPFENLGAELLRTVASRTNDDSGDGTATATVLAEAIFEGCLQNVSAGAYAMALKRGIDMAVETVIGELNRLSRPVSLNDVSEVCHVGTIAADGDAETGKVLAEALRKVGRGGVITVEDGKGAETYLEWVEGMQFEMGYLSPYFVTDSAEMKAILKDCHLLVHQEKISGGKDIIPLLEKIATSGKPLLIIADEIENDALATLEENKLRGTVSVCAIKAPHDGDRRKAIMEDIAVFTGATAVNGDFRYEFEKQGLPMLGRAKRVVVDRKSTMIVEGAGDSKAIRDRIDQIRNRIETAASDLEKENLSQRLAHLAGGVAQIHVCAPSEVELKERKLRVKGALNAARAAIEEGILPGGGVALVRAAKALAKVKTVSNDERTGVDIICRALEAPIKQLAANSGVEGEEVIAKVRETEDTNFGFNARTLEYGDMMKFGVIDSTKIVRSALLNAASVAALLLTSGALISESPGREAPGRSGAAAMGGGG